MARLRVESSNSTKAAYFARLFMFSALYFEVAQICILHAPCEAKAAASLLCSSPMKMYDSVNRNRLEIVYWLLTDLRESSNARMENIPLTTSPLKAQLLLPSIPPQNMLYCSFHFAVQNFQSLGGFIEGKFAG